MVGIMVKVLVIVLIVFYALCNIIVAVFWDTREMRMSFIKDQCIVGMVCANIFYAPAWFLKGVRRVVLAVIK